MMITYTSDKVESLWPLAQRMLLLHKQYMLGGQIHSWFFAFS